MIISLMKNKEKISKTAGGGEELHIEERYYNRHFRHYAISRTKENL